MLYSLSFIQNQLLLKPVGKQTLKEYPTIISVTLSNLGDVSH